MAVSALVAALALVMTGVVSVGAALTPSAASMVAALAVAAVAVVSVAVVSVAVAAVAMSTVAMSTVAPAAVAVAAVAVAAVAVAAVAVAAVAVAAVAVAAVAVMAVVRVTAAPWAICTRDSSAAGRTDLLPVRSVESPHRAASWAVRSDRRSRGLCRPASRRAAAPWPPRRSWACRRGRSAPDRARREPRRRRNPRCRRPRSIRAGSWTRGGTAASTQPSMRRRSRRTCDHRTRGALHSRFPWGRNCQATIHRRRAVGRPRHYVLACASHRPGAEPN